jgi:hypothetical protein
MTFFIACLISYFLLTVGKNLDITHDTIFLMVAIIMAGGLAGKE